MEINIRNYNLLFGIGCNRGIAQVTGGDALAAPFGDVQDSYRKLALIIWSGRRRWAKKNNTAVPTETIEQIEDELEEFTNEDVLAIFDAYNKSLQTKSKKQEEGQNNHADPTYSATLSETP